MSHTGQKITTFRDRLSELCEESPLNATALADGLHVSKQTLSAWRSGERSPKMPTVDTIARYFDVTIEWLLGFDVAKRPKRIPEGVDNLVALPPMSRLPLIGSIACGTPITAQENVEDWIDVPTESRGDFVLRCKGDSMKDARILDGDLVVIRQQDDVQDGQIAAVLIDDDATLKRLFHLPGGSVLLQPANAAYPPIVCGGADESRTIRILGLATHFISRVV